MAIQEIINQKTGEHGYQVRVKGKTKYFSIKKIEFSFLILIQLSHRLKISYVFDLLVSIEDFNLLIFVSLTM